MTISSSANKTIALGNGSATQFAFGFIGVAAAYISVIYTDASGNQTTLSQGSGSSQYQISLNSAPQGGLWGIGGTVTYNPGGTPIATGTTLTIARELPLTQAISLQNQISLAELGDGAETGLDTLEMQIQQVEELTARAIVAPITDPSTINLTLPAAAQRANAGIAFDSFGNVIAGTTPATGLISSVMQPVVDAASLAAGRTAFGLGAMATEGIGSGLSDDGAGNARINYPIVQVSTGQTVLASFNLQRYVATGPINFTFPRANTLWSGFGFWIQAVTGDITMVIDSHDTVSGMLSSGTAFTIPAGATVFVTTDAAASGNWYVSGIPWLVQQPRSISGTYNISASDNAKILVHNSGAFGTIIFPSGSTLPANFRCLIVNGETTPIGKGVGGTNIGSGGSFTLYPSQSYTVINNVGVITVVGGKQLYVVNSVAVYMDTTYGSDNPLVSDGLSTGSRAFLTANHMYAVFKSDFDHNGSGSASMNTMAGTITESIVFSGQPINCPVFFVNGPSALGTTWKPSSNYCWIVGDGCVMEFSNIGFDNQGGSPTAVAIQMHQLGVCDQNSGCGFGSFGNPGGGHLAGDGAGWTYNFNAAYAVNGAGGAGVHISVPCAGFVNVTGSIAITTSNTPNIAYWFRLVGSGANVSLGSSLTFPGTGLVAGCQKWFSGTGSVLSLAGNAANIPGSVAGNPTTGSSPTGSTGWANA